jgi:hypothetical protein
MTYFNVSNQNKNLFKLFLKLKNILKKNTFLNINRVPPNLVQYSFQLDVDRFLENSDHSSINQLPNHGFSGGGGGGGGHKEARSTTTTIFALTVIHVSNK